MRATAGRCVRACVRERACTRRESCVARATLTLRTARARVRPNRFGARSRRSPGSRTDRQALSSSRRRSVRPSTRFEPRGSEESGTEAQPLVRVCSAVVVFVRSSDGIVRLFVSTFDPLESKSLRIVVRDWTMENRCSPVIRETPKKRIIGTAFLSLKPRWLRFNDSLR